MMDRLKALFGKKREEAPYGYTFQPVAEPDAEGAGGGEDGDAGEGSETVALETVEHPGEQRILQLIHSLHGNGYSYVDITHRLNKSGLYRRNGRKWRPKQVLVVHEEAYPPPEYIP